VIKAVLDTVVFVRALINPHGPSGKIIKKIEKFDIVTSPPIIKEVLEVLFRSSLQKKFRLSQLVDIEEILEVIKQASVVKPKEKIKICRDPKDNKFLECALAGKADYIISEDKDLLVLKKYKETKIINTKTFLQLL